MLCRQCEQRKRSLGGIVVLPTQDLAAQVSEYYHAAQMNVTMLLK